MTDLAIDWLESLSDEEYEKVKKDVDLRRLIGKNKELIGKIYYFSHKFYVATHVDTAGNLMGNCFSFNEPIEVTEYVLVDTRNVYMVTPKDLSDRLEKLLPGFKVILERK